MKQKSFFGCVLAALCLAGISLFGLSACSKSGKCTMEKDGGVSFQLKMYVPDASMDAAMKEEALNCSVNVLRTRLERRGVQADVRIVGSDRITVEFPGKEEGWPYYRLLQSEGGLEFWETYDADEIEDELAQLELENLMLIPQNRYRTPVVGQASYADTARVNAYLSSPFAQSVLPRDIRFAWSHKAVDEQGIYYELVALRARSNGRPAMEGDIVTSAKATRADYDESRGEIKLNMNEEGARMWQRVTRENVGKSIVFVIDGDVYSYPIVQAEIKGGRCFITGDFTFEEAQELADILQSGQMPCRFIIVQEDYIQPKK